MSYCVNCGVELDVTAVACPLCNTKIYNPNQPPATDVPTPYATVKGYIEPVKKKEFTILTSTVLSVTALVCLFLNTFTIQIGHWSYYVAGICVMLWIFMIPLLLMTDHIRNQNRSKWHLRYWKKRLRPEKLIRKFFSLRKNYI